jgi:hypothetical protein
MITSNTDPAESLTHPDISWEEFKSPEAEVRAHFEDELPPVRAALELYNTPPDNSDCLLGDRFLCRGGGMLLVGPSGVGKSTFTAGLCFAIARGEEYLGIEPSAQLKVLVIQSENDDGDLHEQLRGAGGSPLDPDGEDAMTSRLFFASVDNLSGESFLRGLEFYLSKHRPDIVVLDCLNAYLGDSPTEPKAIIDFLRTGLTPLLRLYGCGVIIVHHTPKTSNQDRSGWTPSDLQYAAAGCADVTNWARAGLLIQATLLPELFRLFATKRGKRLGWKLENGKPTIFKLIRHARLPVTFNPLGPLPALRWEVADEDDRARLLGHENRKKASLALTRTPDMFLGKLPEPGRGRASCLLSGQIRDKLKEAGICPKDSFASWKQDLEDQKVIASIKIGKDSIVGRPDDIEAVRLAHFGPVAAAADESQEHIKSPSVSEEPQPATVKAAHTRKKAGKRPNSKKGNKRKNASVGRVRT